MKRRKFIPPATTGNNKHNSYANAFWLHLINSNDERNDNDSNMNVVHVQFTNGMAETPHEIVLDYTCKSTVIATRGSWSLENFVIYAMPDATSLGKVTLHKSSSIFVNNNKQYCHSDAHNNNVNAQWHTRTWFVAVCCWKHD